MDWRTSDPVDNLRFSCLWGELAADALKGMSECVDPERLKLLRLLSKAMEELEDARDALAECHKSMSE
jgi:hypothetical protein